MGTRWGSCSSSPSLSHSLTPPLARSFARSPAAVAPFPRSPLCEDTKDSRTAEVSECGPSVESPTELAWLAGRCRPRRGESGRGGRQECGPQSARRSVRRPFLLCGASAFLPLAGWLAGRRWSSAASASASSSWSRRALSVRRARLFSSFLWEQQVSAALGHSIKFRRCLSNFVIMPDVI